MSQGAAPPVSFGGPTSAAWREEVLTRAEELDGLQGWVRARNASDASSLGIVDSIRRHLDAARDTAAGDDRRPRRERLVAAVRGSSVERTLGNLDAVETDLLRLAPLDYVRGQMPSLQAHVCRFLPKDDPRRLRLAAIARDAPHKEITEIERDNVIAAFHAASSQRRRELFRLRSFRNVLVAATVLMLVVAVGLGVLGSARPDAIPLCFTPDPGRVCPTGEVLPGLSALDSSAQIISWAVVFG